MKVHQRRNWTRLISYTILTVVAFSILWLNVFSSFILVAVNGHSMEPTYKHGSIHLANKKISSLQHGNVIIFKVKNETYIKRIVALPNDEIPVCYGIENGRFYSSIVTMKYVGLDLTHEWITIPEGYVWVEGDAENISSGSGYIGLVDIKDIIGIMNYIEEPKTFWYPSVVNKREIQSPKKSNHKHD